MDGAGRTLLGDLLTAVADKYEKLYNFPALSPTMNGLGTTLQQRMNYNASGVVATRNADNTVTVTVKAAARIPVTGAPSMNRMARGRGRLMRRSCRDAICLCFIPLLISCSQLIQPV